MNQVRRHKLLQMMRDGGLSNRELGNQCLTGNFILPGDTSKDRKPLRIGKCLRNLLDLLVRQLDLGITHILNLGRADVICQL